MANERIVAVGLLTQREVELLGHGFSRLWPIDDAPCFEDLLQAIDEADLELSQASNRSDSRGREAESMPGGGDY